MAQQTINVGTADKGNGDPLRTAFIKVNNNFNELYNLVGGTVAELTEIARDYTAPLFTHSSHTGIAFTYDDANNKLIAVVASQLPGQSGNNGKYLTTNGSTLSWATTPSTDRLINGTDKVVLNQEGASRLSMYVNNVEKSRLQINTNDLLFSSLAGGVTLSALDGVGGDWFFRTDGELHSTGGKFLSTAETPAVFGSLDSPLPGASSGTVTIKSGTGTVDGGSIYIQAGTGTTGNNGEVVIKTGTTPYEWQFDNGGNLTIPGEIHGKQLTGVGGTPNGRAVNITPANDASDKQFKFRVDQYGETFTRAYLDMPTAQNNKQVAITFAHENSTAGYIFTQGADTFDYGLNNAFNIFYNAGDIKLTAMTPVTGTFKTWTYGTDGRLYLPSIGGGGGAILRSPLNESIGISAYNDTGAGTTYTLSVATTGPVNIPTASTGLGRLQNPDGIEILTNSGESAKLWAFGDDGKLTLPDGYAQIVVENNGVRIGTADMNVAPNSQIRIGGPNHVFEIFGGPPSYSWKFDIDGSLTLPNNGVISAGGSGGLTLGGNFDVKIVADYTDNNRTWTFGGTDGSITFPDSTIQTTAYTGTRTIQTVSVQTPTAITADVVFGDSNAAAGNVNLVLPNNADNGTEVTVKNINAGGFSVFVSTDGIQNIETESGSIGSGVYATISTNGASISWIYQSATTTWRIIG